MWISSASIGDLRGIQRVGSIGVQRVIPLDESDNKAKEQTLHDAFPTTTRAERLRFMAKCDVKKASRKISMYLEWRKKLGLDDEAPLLKEHSVSNVEEEYPVMIAAYERSIECASQGTFESHDCDYQKTTVSDEDDWNDAARAAAAFLSEELTEELPMVARLLRTPAVTDGKPNASASSPVLDKKGNQILYVQPALLDPSIASTSTYSLCAALYLDKRLGRSSMEKITIAIDTRFGRGWANPMPLTLVPFVKSVVRLLSENLPERLASGVVFPVPKLAVGMWSIFKAALPPKIACKLHLINGPANENSPIPRGKKMKVYFDDTVIQLMEQNRILEFR